MAKKISAYHLNTFTEKSKGLMFEREIYTVYFQTRYGIHTFFMKKPIGIVVLDNSFTIQKIITANPWRIYFWNPKYKNIVEMSVFMIHSRGLKVGDTVKIIDTERKKN